MTFGRVEDDWDPDFPVYVIGGGPSLAPYVDELRDRLTRDVPGYIIGVNRAAEFVSCDATFSLDRKFAEEYATRLSGWAHEGQEVYLAVPEDWFRSHPALVGVTYLRRRSIHGLSTEPDVIANGLNSGYGALNLAVLKGARTIYLLGFDLVAPARGGATHWHDGYDWSNGSSRTYFDRWAQRFEAAARDCARLGVRVVNANPRSAVRAFEFTTYEALGL